MQIVKAVIIGAGRRGQAYASYATVVPKKFKIVGVAEPFKVFRDQMIAEYGLKEENAFETWEHVVNLEKRIADVAIICTQDRMHKDPAIKLASQGYHILLEKPMAVSYKDCYEIFDAVHMNDVIFGVCHILRYYPQYKKIKDLIDEGVIEEVCNIQHCEPVGFWRFAHSYVRGHWRNESESSCSLLAKCCHDLDLITFWMGKENPCVKIPSFGSLMNFTKDHKPEGATSMCLSCPLSKECSYSAQKIYVDRARAGSFEFPVSVVTKIRDMEDLMEQLETGPYGRCVYDCDNDVMSNQVVNMQFQNGATANFTMVGFTRKVGTRRTVISGTKGEITCDFAEPVKVFDFLTEQISEHEVCRGQWGKLGGHGGADFHLIQTFIDAVQAEDQSLIPTGPEETLESHHLVFAAEQ